MYRWSDGRKFEGQWAHNRTAICYRGTTLSHVVKTCGFLQQESTVPLSVQFKLASLFSSHGIVIGYLFFLSKTSTRLEKECIAKQWAEVAAALSSSGCMGLDSLLGWRLPQSLELDRVTCGSGWFLRTGYRDAMRRLCTVPTLRRSVKGWSQLWGGIHQRPKRRRGTRTHPSNHLHFHSQHGSRVFVPFEIFHHSMFGRIFESCIVRFAGNTLDVAKNKFLQVSFKDVRFKWKREPKISPIWIILEFGVGVLMNFGSLVWFSQVKSQFFLGSSKVGPFGFPLRYWFIQWHV